MAEKVRVLFLCTGNSCRSQMAEGWARHLKGDVIEPCSAGIEAHRLNPRAGDTTLFDLGRVVSWDSWHYSPVAASGA